MPSDAQQSDVQRSVLVFAGASFIGRHIVERLTAEGCAVTMTSRRRGQGLLCDLTNREQVIAAIREAQPDWIIQCGAATSTTDPRQLYPVHITGTLNVLEAVKEHAPEARLLIMGSAAEYGPVGPERLPVTEGCEADPPSFFGASKLAQTQLARAAAATNRLRVTVVRPFNVIGPGLPDFYFAKSLALRLAAMAKNGQAAGTPFEIVNADATRDFVDVRDVARAVEALLASDVSPAGSAEVFNICTGTETSLLDAARLLGELAGGLIPQPAGSAASRGGIVRSVGSCGKLQQRTGWSPQWTWQQSLRDLWAEVRS